MRWIFAFFAIALATSALAQASFPSKPVTMVVGLRAGRRDRYRGADRRQTMARTSGSRCWSRTAPAAGGNIAVDYVAKSAPDGYTMVLANVGALAVNPT